MFAVAKRESKALHQDFKQKCSIATSVNGWMNDFLSLRWCNETLGQFSFSKQLLAWDSVKAHLTNDQKKSLKLSKTKTVFVPSGSTKYIRAPNLWNKPIKGRIQELYDEWLANGKHGYAAAGNMKPVPRRFVVEWVLTSWSAISNKTIDNSMNSCGLASAIDGSDDKLICCFKKGKTCESRKAMLGKQLQIFNDSILQNDPFVLSDQDIAEAATHLQYNR